MPKVYLMDESTMVTFVSLQYLHFCASNDFRKGRKRLMFVQEVLYRNFLRNRAASVSTNQEEQPEYARCCYYMLFLELSYFKSHLYGWIFTQANCISIHVKLQQVPHWCVECQDRVTYIILWIREGFFVFRSN